jgi:hypothetical protein
VGDNEERRARDFSLTVPAISDVVGATAGDYRADAVDEAVKGRRAHGRHSHPRVEPARRVAVLEPGEELFAAGSQSLLGTVVRVCDKAVERYCDRSDDLSRRHVPSAFLPFPGFPGRACMHPQ